MFVRPMEIRTVLQIKKQNGPKILKNNANLFHLKEVGMATD